MGLIWLSLGEVAVACKCGIELLSSIKSKENLDYLRKC